MNYRMKDLLRRYGVWGIVQRCWAKGWSLLGLRVERMHLMAHMLIESEDDLPEYRELTMEDFQAHREEDPEWFTPLKMKKLKRYFIVPGNRAFGCFDEDELIAYGWISEQYLGYSNRPLQACDGYLWDDYTHPDYRGRGWHLKLIKIREKELMRRGKVRALSVVANYNRASRRGYQRAGYSLLERYRYGTRWGKPFLRRRYGA